MWVRRWLRRRVRRRVRRQVRMQVRTQVRMWERCWNIQTSGRLPGHASSPKREPLAQRALANLKSKAVIHVYIPVIRLKKLTGIAMDKFTIQTEALGTYP